MHNLLLVMENLKSIEITITILGIFAICHFVKWPSGGCPYTTTLMLQSESSGV